MSSIAELLGKARQRSFVGRDREVAIFQNLLQAPEPEAVLIYLHGVGGQGKTTLLKHLADHCGTQQVVHFQIDAREIEPHPVAFEAAVRGVVGKALTVPAHFNVYEAVAEVKAPRAVLFIDTYERIAPLDEWMRLEFLPRLPDNFLTVIGSRNPPGLPWITDSGWKVLMRAVHLQSFTRAESADYLTRRGLPAAQIAPIVDFTHGHPLALSVVADMHQQYPEKNFNPEESPDVVRTLLQLFVNQVPSPMHRAALEVCALVSILTESLLAEVMDIPDVSELFNWLCGLSFISMSRDGIYPHDITREALTNDVRWRHPAWNTELHRRSRAYYHRKLKETTGDTQRRVLFDLLWLHRSNAVVKPFFDWQETGAFWVDTATPADWPQLAAMVAHHEGGASLEAFHFWCKHPASQIWVWRDGSRQANAFVLKINANEIGQVGEIPADPPMERVLEYQRQQLHLRTNEQFAVFRFWMAKDTYQQVSALQSSIFLHIVQYYFTPGLAVSAFEVIQPEFWKAAFLYADLWHQSDLDFMVNGQPHGWYSHDWRARPPLAWLDLLGRRETDPTLGMDQAQPSLHVQVLSQEEFEEHVSEALRHFHNNTVLQQNPLLRAKMVLQEIGIETTDLERITCLKNQISEALAKMDASPVDSKYHRVLHRTFVNPVGSQEKTADFLNMSFSTYRRYLSAGIQRLGQMLWKTETGA